MKKAVIAVDIDDVLASSTDALRLEVNKRLGVELEPKHYQIPGEYWGYYERVWQGHGIEGRVTMDELDPQMKADQTHVAPHMSAAEVLKKLTVHFRLVVVTSRNESWESATKKWLESHFSGIFSDLIFAGRKSDKFAKTKGQVCREIGASWLIDDNVEHAHTALAEGIQVILFGDYGWQQNVPKEMVRCKDWASIEEYFDGRDS